MIMVSPLPGKYELEASETGASIPGRAPRLTVLRLGDSRVRHRYGQPAHLHLMRGVLMRIKPFCKLTRTSKPGTERKDRELGSQLPASRFQGPLFCLQHNHQGRARTQSPTTRNYAVEIPTFGEFAWVSTAAVQWLSLALGEPPS